MRRPWRIPLFVLFTLAVLVGAFSLHPIPQDPAYHLFADNRPLFGIPNYFDVISNLLFLVAGIWGLIFIVPRRQTLLAFRENYERWPYIIFFFGIALTGLGSAYYHWSPNNRTLVWDRLPMAIAFMGIFAGTLGDRISARAGRLWLIPMLGIGIFSVLYWHSGELKGQGDLRLYVVVQYFTIAAVYLLTFLFPARYTHAGWLFAGGGAYVLAKVLEQMDQQIFDIWKISGHTLKHLAASLTAFCIVGMLKQRRGKIAGIPRN
jgi:hypothetical protein